MAVGSGTLALVAPLLLLLITVTPSCSMVQLAARPGCSNTCGNVNIPFPFGMGDPSCFREGFKIDCTDGTPKLKDTDYEYEIQNISMTPDGGSIARVLLPIAYQCYNESSTSYANYSYGTVSFNRQGVYRISDKLNELVVIGCNTQAYISSVPVANKSAAPYPYDIYTGCISYCLSAESVIENWCAGVGCCRVDIPAGLTETWVTFGGYPHNKYFLPFSACSYGFLVDKRTYNFTRADLQMSAGRRVPVWLDWAIRPSDAAAPKLTCADAKRNGTAYACVSPNSVCVDAASNLTGYNCQCQPGYEGNPYLPDNVTGNCQDINECAPENKDKYCYGPHCDNTPGNYTCRCGRGFRSDDPKTQRCQPIITRPAQIVIGVVCGLAFIAIAAIFMLMVHHKRKLKEFFEKNGGSMLENVSNIKIFTKDDLKQMTKNYSIILGKGGFGEVYMGTLENNQQVAVKRSILLDEDRKKEFANEVIIQSRISHINVVKLVGCCVEVDIPMLVYEFAPKGSLYDVLHGTNKENMKASLSLATRLDIAVQSAEGLSYMHSSANQKILHGDVKSGNILLDSNFIPKVSDFGTSRLLSIEKKHTMKVIGDINYIDPVYMKTGRLDEKSDVYSFGTVLLELITRMKPRYDGNNSLIINFCKSFASDEKARGMYDQEIASTENIEFLHKVGSVAVDCLKDDMDARPNMRQVMDRLHLVRMEYKQKHGDQDEISMESPPVSASMDATGSGTPGYSPLLRLYPQARSRPFRSSLLAATHEEDDSEAGAVWFRLRKGATSPGVTLDMR
ncbi:hypothetical protein EJB05_13236, partial [Eragrostis curvula]